jgi:hypothetical protein
MQAPPFATKAKVEELCVGKASCSITAETAFFGADPCFDVVK